jgi:hypothetical protein
MSIAIRNQREAFWGAFPGLVHTPLRVYPSPTLPLQFVVVNRFDFNTKDGARFAHTAAEYTLVESEGNYLVEKLVLYMASWTDLLHAVTSILFIDPPYRTQQP